MMSDQTDDERFRKLQARNVGNTMQGAKFHAEEAQRKKLAGDDAGAQKQLDRAHHNLDQASQQLDKLRDETVAKIKARKEKKKK
ncbi:MAG: hypothetical protein ACFE0J_22280 [Elainellaceae cyanobacterium]